MSRLRVLHAIRQGQIGGGESHVLSVVRTMDRERFDPVVLSFTNGQMVDQLRKLNITTHVIESTRPFDLRVWNKVGQLLKDERIDLVHAHGTRGLSNVLWAARQQVIPLLYTVHGWSFHPGQSWLLHNLRVVAERFLINRSHRTICVSRANLSEGRLFLPKLQADVVLNGIDLHHFRPRQDFPDVRAQYGIQPYQLVIGFVARLTFQKDPLTLIDAFSLVAAKHPKAVLLLIGSGDLKDAVARRISELGLSNRIITDGYRQDVPAVLNAMDVFCLPSRWEGMPIGLMEAMAMEKPVVVSAVDGTVELITHEENGLLVHAEHPGQLANALHQLISDENLRRKLASRARQRIEQHHDVRAMTRRLEQLYQATVARSAPVTTRVAYG